MPTKKILNCKEKKLHGSGCIIFYVEKCLFTPVFLFYFVGTCVTHVLIVIWVFFLFFVWSTFHRTKGWQICYVIQGNKKKGESMKSSRMRLCCSQKANSKGVKTHNCNVHKNTIYHRIVTVIIDEMKTKPIVYVKEEYLVVILHPKNYFFTLITADKLNFVFLYESTFM